METKFLLTATLLVLIVHVSAKRVILADKRLSNEERFVNFIKKYHKEYKNGTAEYKQRLEIFSNNLKIQDSLNAKRPHNSSAMYGVTKYSDLTQEEFQGRYLSAVKLHTLPTPPPLLLRLGQVALGRVKGIKDLPDKVDWREKKVVSPVRNQLSCGGCWAFSTVETVESMYAIHTGKLPSLSVQEVIDCSQGFDRFLYACKGGDTCHAMSWLEQEQVPLVPEDHYPLTDKAEQCHIQPNSTQGIRVKSHTCDRFVDQEDRILQALATVGPVTVSVDANTWNNYLGGVIQYHCGGPGTGNNHAVQIVGYNRSGDVPYYIVKNSWGPDWGEDGYLYIKVGGNVCGIANEVSTIEVVT